MRYAVGGFLILLVVFSSAFAEKDKKTVQVREEFISIDVHEKSFADIIEGIREQTGKNIIYDAELQDIKVTIELTQLPWRKVLEVIAKEYKCLVEDIGLGVVKVSKPPTVTMEFDGADIRDVVNQIATIANKNIILSEQVKGTVTLRIQGVPWREALEAIIKNAGFALVEEASGRILRVVSPEEIQAQLETRIFKLRYVRPKSPFIAEMTSEFFTKGGNLAAANQRNRNQQQVNFSQFSLLNALNAVTTPNRGRITYDENTNTLVITDVKPKLTRMKEIIKEIDIEPKQIFIDIKFVRTVNTDIFDFGLGFGETGINIIHRFGEMASRLPFTLGEGGFEDYLAAVPEEGANGLDQEGFPNDNDLQLALDDQRDGVALTLGSLDFTQTQFVLRVLKQDTRTKVIQAPKIVTLDHHEATIFVGDTIAFAKQELIQNDNGSVSVQLVEADNSPVTVGFQILVVPHVIPGTNKIQITVIPKNDVLSGQDNNANIPGFNRFVSGDQEILLPQLTSQVIVTHMLLESGQTAVVGGLLSVTQAEDVRKVPFLGDLPLVGYFFKDKSINKRKEDLFIFITPRIVQSSEDTEEKLKANLTDYRTSQEKQYSVIWGGEKEEGQE